MNSPPLPNWPDKMTVHMRIPIATVFILIIAYTTIRLFLWDTEFFDPYVVFGASISNLAMVICGLMLLVFWADYYANASTRYYQLLACEIFLMLFFNTMYYLGIGEQGNPDLQEIVICLRSVIVPLILLTFWIYLDDVTSDARWHSAAADTVMFSVTAVQLFILTVNTLFGFLYSVGPDGVMARADMFFLLTVCLMCLVAICWHRILKQLFGFRRILALSAFLFLPILCNFIDYYVDVGLRFVSYALVFFIIYGNHYVRRVEEMIDVEGEMMMRNSEALLSQVKPHFLYNSLTSIMNIPGTPAYTKDVIADFGKYLRGNIDSVLRMAPIPFEKEVEYTELYIEMQKLNFGDGLNLKLDIRARNFRLPAMSLRTLVSNCVEYGIAPKGHGTIFISSKETDTGYEVRVADDGIGYTGTNTDPEQTYYESVVAYRSVKHVLKDTLNASITCYSVEGHGTAFNIRIPKAGRSRDTMPYTFRRESS